MNLRPPASLIGLELLDCIIIIQKYKKEPESVI